MKGGKWKTSRTTSSRSLIKTQATEGGHRGTSRWLLTFSQEMLTGCKPPIANLLNTLADTCDVGSGGCSEFSLENEAFKPLFSAQTVVKYVTCDCGRFHKDFVAAIARSYM